MVPETSSSRIREPKGSIQWPCSILRNKLFRKKEDYFNNDNNADLEGAPRAPSGMPAHPYRSNPPVPVFHEPGFHDQHELFSVNRERAKANLPRIFNMGAAATNAFFERSNMFKEDPLSAKELQKDRLPFKPAYVVEMPTFDACGEFANPVISAQSRMHSEDPYVACPPIESCGF